MNKLTFAQIALAGVLAGPLVGCAPDPVREAPAQVQMPSTQPAAPTTPALTTAQRNVAPKPTEVNALNDASNAFAKRSVYYPLDRYVVEPEFQPMLKAHAAYLSGHPGASVLIEGNCDERGSREYNLALGQRRAENVQKMMILLGASAKQIESVSFGEEKPRSSGHEESSWSQNRRSDIVYKREQ